ncbi:MAG: NAD(P)-binding domain-containing protein, partial [Chloroflexota bacterium]
MHPAREADVMVIGAGPAGLAVSRELRKRRVDHLVIERGEIGQSWRRYYDGLVLHTGRHLSSLPGRPFR